MTAELGAAEDEYASSWEGVVLLPVEPPPLSDRDEVFVVDGERYRELSESGWDALMAWLVGISHLARYPERRTQHVDVTVTDRLGHVQDRHQVARTAADQAIIDTEANSYLRDAGIPERPSGYRWFQRLPDGHALEDVEGAVAQAFEVSPPLSMHPRHVAPVMRDALDRIYRRQP
ncbi:DUF5956 family protein [Micromonospora sp. NBC_01796]|uniref:DUF5956 family protein n=1 Tax=Micromonospora sp. NBC_01796 TaxID=2975987 RepID=UPI002DDC724F|nr:DUF5956 family protein [Micromonospora sp. NBC_01796]WSA83201.1 DUF5956 family protein [Micromonospora sp. NBC_01796]